MEVDGKVITQTGAIARYCGKLGGLYPKDDDFSAAKVDEIIDTATDITNLVGPTMRMGEAEKLEARKVGREKQRNPGNLFLREIYTKKRITHLQ